MCALVARSARSSSSARRRRGSTSTGGCSGSASTAPGIEREGYVDETRLWQLMMAADVHVNLRSPTMGETSGTAIRALSLGKPLVVSDVGWFAELPDDVALKIPVDEQRDRDARGGARAARDAARRARAPWARRRSSSRAAGTTSAVSPSSTSRRSSRPRVVPSVDDAVLREVSEAAAAVGIAPDSVEARELAARLAEVDLGD